MRFRGTAGLGGRIQGVVVVVVVVGRARCTLPYRKWHLYQHKLLFMPHCDGVWEVRRITSGCLFHTARRPTLLTPNSKLPSLKPETTHTA